MHALKKGILISAGGGGSFSSPIKKTPIRPKNQEDTKTAAAGP